MVASVLLDTGDMAMNYYGPATVLVPGGEVSVEASLHVEYDSVAIGGGSFVEFVQGRKGWLGSLQAAPGGPLHEAFGARPCLRLPDGSLGEFVASSLGSDGRMEITGTGPAPFWDEADEPTP